jgi:Tfp pilus assembly protein PilN
MRQQINLYQLAFRRERQKFSAAMVLAALGLLVAALSVFSFKVSRDGAELQRQVARFTGEQAQQQSTVAKAGELRAQRSRVDVEAQVKSLTAALHERKEALRVLQSGAAGQTSGFASRLEALARRHVEGLWIESLAMSGTPDTMSLSGGSLDAGTVPIYLRGLSSEPALIGARFDYFVIERPDGGGSPVRFHAGSSQLPQADALRVSVR